MSGGIVSKVKAEYRRVRRKLTTKTLQKSDLGFDDENPRIAILVTGGIGDHIVAARYMRDLFASVGPVEFDLYSSRPAVAEWIFASLPTKRSTYNEYLQYSKAHSFYPLSLHVIQFVAISGTPNWFKVSKRWPALVNLGEALEQYRPRIRACIQEHPYLDGHLGKLAVFSGYSRRNFLQGMSGIKYAGDGFDLPMPLDTLQRHHLVGRDYVTIHNGFDADAGNAPMRSTKFYPHFDKVAELIRDQFPDIVIVQLGTSTSTPIASAHVNLIKKTNIEDTAALLRGSSLHIDVESGLVHMASCVGTECVVVFGPTSVDYYAYPQNTNLKPPVCGDCWWLTPTWGSICVKGAALPPCTYEQKPEVVFDAVRTRLLARRASAVSLIAPADVSARAHY